MITEYNIFESKVKEDGAFKYKVGDMVKYRPKKNKTVSTSMYEIVSLKNDFVTIFTGPTRQVRKNSYMIESGEYNFAMEVRESDIRKMRVKEIEEYKNNVKKIFKLFLVGTYWKFENNIQYIKNISKVISRDEKTLMIQFEIFIESKGSTPGGFIDLEFKFDTLNGWLEEGTFRKANSEDVDIFNMEKNVKKFNL